MKRVLNKLTIILEEVIALYKEKKYEQAYQLMMSNGDILHEIVLPEKEKAIFCYVMQYMTLYNEQEKLNYQIFFKQLDDILTKEPTLLVRMKKDFPKAMRYFIQQSGANSDIQYVDGREAILMTMNQNIESFYSLKQALLCFLKQSHYRKELYECIHQTMIIIDKEIIEQSTRDLNDVIQLAKDNRIEENQFFKKFICYNNICFEVYQDLIDTRYYSNDDFLWIVSHLQLVHHIFSVLQQHQSELNEDIKHMLSKQRRIFNRLLLSFTQLYWEKYHSEYRYLQNELTKMENKLQSFFILKNKKEKISTVMEELLLVKDNPMIYSKNQNYQLLIQKYNK